MIAPDELVKYAPLEMAQKGVIATQFPMGPIEELGLLKMDFLGLSNLTIINNALRIVRKVYGKEIDLSSLPMDDAKTYKLFQSGDTTGVFQLESAGMKRYLKELKPTEFNDIIAMVALYRPGPMSEIPKFVARKHGHEKITYYEEHMKNALEDTYGILVYQEQFMQISKEVCGFTGGEADTLRKAVGKKKMDLMKQMKEKLIDGGVKTSGADRAKMEAFWDHLEEFANYCFNKSHAACYAMIAYWTAYIKAHYPSAFMAALMTSDAGNIDRLSIEIAECKHMGIKVLLPDINESFTEFAIVPETGDIRFGLAAVKGVGGSVVEEIEKARKVEKFSSIEDYAKRVSSRISNKKVWENLIKSGAFDKFRDEKGFPSRSDLLFNLEQITEFARKVQSDVASGQGSLFEMAGVEDMTSLKLMSAPQQATEKEQLTWERELLGLYLSAHPLDKYDTYFIEQTNPINSLNSDMEGASAVVGGLVSVVRPVVTKSGSKMAFLTLEDKTGQIDIVVFAKLYEDFGEQLRVDAVLKIEGRVSARDRDGNKLMDPSIVANNIMVVTDSELDNYQSTGQKMVEPKINGNSKPKTNGTYWRGGKNGDETVKSKKSAEKYDYSPDVDIDETLYIHIKDPSDGDKLVKMKEKLSDFKGDNSIVLVLGEDKKDVMKLPFTTGIDDKLVDELKQLIGDDCVIVK